MISKLFDLTGRVALVTGGSRGLGKAMATIFAEAGASVLLSSRHETELQAAAAGLEAGVVQRALQLRCVLLQHRQRLRLFDRQMRGHLAAAVDIDANIDAAKVSRVESDFEAALAVLDRSGDLEREPA